MSRLLPTLVCLQPYFVGISELNSAGSPGASDTVRVELDVNITNRARDDPADHSCNCHIFLLDGQIP